MRISFSVENTVSVNYNDDGYVLGRGYFAGISINMSSIENFVKDGVKIIMQVANKGIRRKSKAVKLGLLKYR